MATPISKNHAVVDALFRVKRGVTADDIAKSLSGMVDGSGGGNPNFARGGGKAPEKLKSALKKMTEGLKEIL